MKLIRFQISLLLLFAITAIPLGAQRVDTSLNHFRVWAVDSVIKGPNGRHTPAHAKGKLGFVAIYNATRTLCLVEYVGLKNEDLDDVRRDKEKNKDKEPKLEVWEKHLTKRSDFTQAARKAGFTQMDLGKFYVRVK